MTTPARHRREPARRDTRRGLASGALLVGLAVLLGLVAVTINVGHVNRVHEQMRIACEAAALAGAAELLDESTLYGTPDQQADIVAAKLTAQRMASCHLIDQQPLALDLNANNTVDGDITVGTVVQPLVLGYPFQVYQGQGVCNSLLVTASRHERFGNPVALWLGGLFGVPTANVSCSARASLDHRVIGFRPKGHTAAPVMPFMLEAASWRQQRQGQVTTDNDRFSVDHHTGQCVAGSDGIIELEFRCPLDDEAANTSVDSNGASNARNGRCALLCVADNHVNVPVVDRQCVAGLVGSDLQSWQGELTLPPSGELIVPAWERGDQLHCDSLWATRGQRRVWPLCTPYEQATRGGRWGVIEFAAGTVVDTYVDTNSQPRQLVVHVQPTMIATSTAITSPTAEEHPSIAKLLLTQ